MELEQESYYTLINTSSRRGKQDEKMKPWRGLTTKIRYGLAKLFFIERLFDFKRHARNKWTVEKEHYYCSIIYYWQRADKIYKISDEVINFIKKTMKNWRVEVTTRGKSLAEVKIKRGIFQVDTLSPLIFVIVIMPLNYMLRNAEDTKFINRKKKINHLIYMDDINLLAKNVKIIGNPNIRKEDEKTTRNQAILQKLHQKGKQHLGCPPRKWTTSNRPENKKNHVEA